jgi:excisionase family DNA binding protein
VSALPVPFDLDQLADALAERVAARLAGIPAKRFLTIKNAAAYADLSSDSIRSLLANGRLTALRAVRGRVLIDRLELEAFIGAATSRPRAGRGIRRNMPSQTSANGTGE